MPPRKITKIKFKVQRYNPEGDKAPYLQEFLVPVSRGMTVLDGLIYIEELKADILEIRSLPNFPVIKDLIPDNFRLLHKHTSIKPYIIRSDSQEMEKPTAEYMQAPGQLESYLQFSYCIKCGICVSACPTSASDKLFLGHQASVQCYRYCADSRDAGSQDRFPVVNTDHGLWHCHLAGACSEAYPKGVDPALGIQLLKRLLVANALGLGRKPQPAPKVPPPNEVKLKITIPEFTVPQRRPDL